MSTTIRLEIKYFRPSSMLNSEFNSVNLPIKPTKNKQKVTEVIKDYLRGWDGKGEIIIISASPNVFNDSYPSNDFFESFSGRVWSFNDGKIRALKCKN